MKNFKTERGFNGYTFMDRYDQECSIQNSSIATEDCIWLGLNDADPIIMASKVMENGTGWVKYPIPDDVLLHTRMHLTKEQVKELIPYLQYFVENGELPTENEDG